LRPHIVHFHHLMNLCRSLPGVARKRGARVVMSVHDYWLLCPRLLLQETNGAECPGPSIGVRCVKCQADGIAGVPGALARSVLRTAVGKALLGRADALVVPSVFVADLLADEGIERKKMRHVPYGVPTAPPVQKISQQGEETGTTVFGYVGSVKPHKGLTELVKAFMGLGHGSKVRLEIYGDAGRDVAYGRHVQYLAANDPRVRFRGLFPPERVFDVMTRLDVLVVPSLWRETGPQVALEALAAGVPVLGSDLGGLKEMVRDGKNGFLFRPGDIEGLRDCMTKVCSGPGFESPSQWDGQAVSTVEENAKRMERVYREVLNA